MTLPAMIVRKADGYETRRLESYDLTDIEWDKLLFGMDIISIAASFRGAPFLGIHTTAVVWCSRQFFTTGSGVGQSKTFPTAAEAMAHHELLARPIVERLDIMLGHEVPVLGNGAL